MGKNEKQKFKEFMSEQRTLSRWAVVGIALFGGFWGAIIALMVVYLGLV